MKSVKQNKVIIKVRNWLAVMAHDRKSAGAFKKKNKKDKYSEKNSTSQKDWQ